MKQNMVRISFDIPEDEYIMLKTTCAQARLAIKDFVQAMIINGIRDFRKDAFRKRLKESIQQAKEGKSKIISSGELDKMFKDAE